MNWSLTPRRRFILAVISGFFAISAIVYGKAVWQSEFVRWDDGMLVYENPAIREISPATTRHIFSTYDPELYIPLTFLSYQLDYQIGGIRPFQYHFTNFLLHTFNSLLVAWFAALIFMRRSATRARGLGIFCGLLFLLHPLHTEGIMWISGRKDLLSTFFTLLTLTTWMRWQDNPARRRRIAAIVFFALALMSKVMAITLPILLLLIDWQRGRRWSWEMIAEKIPFLALSALFGLIGLGGKTYTVASSTILEKILMAGKSSVFYLRKIVWPDSFSLLYPYHKDIVIASPDFYIPIVVWIAILLLLTSLRKRTRDVAFGTALYLVAVAPTFLNFTKGGDLDVYFASDRYAYFPSIGAFIAVAGLLMVAGRRVRGYAPPVVASIIIAILGYRSYLQSKVWRTTYELLTNVLRQYPESHVAHNNIANAWRLEGRLDDAIGEFKKALAIRPHAKIYANLGAVYRKQGKIAEAMDAYGKGLALNPQSSESYMGRALVYIAKKDYAAAEQDLLSSLRENPRYIEARINLGAVYAYQGNMQKAIEQYTMALALNPFYPDVRFNMGVALQSTGDIEGALAQYERAVRLAPGLIPARINYGVLLYQTGDRDGAREQFEAILKADPENVAANKALRQILGNF
ncbi:tetratricopeptide repeat protein [Candidatus Peregrinibacteria bacterium]|nr:tetratricopeptide repeat protein [Candidatus Peregrinibacteria bacterium]